MQKNDSFKAPGLEALCTWSDENRCKNSGFAKQRRKRVPGSRRKGLAHHA